MEKKANVKTFYYMATWHSSGVHVINVARFATEIGVRGSYARVHRCLVSSLALSRELVLRFY